MDRRILSVTAVTPVAASCDAPATTDVPLDAAFETSAVAATTGKIVVNNDEWTLSDARMAQAPDAAPFARNVAAWFTGGAPALGITFLSLSRCIQQS
jgi:hypothetical protein